MNPGAAIYIVSQALKLVVILAAPPLAAGLVVGLIISTFQAVTQIQEMTLSFVPKIIVVFAVLIIFFPWMLRLMTSFTTDLIVNLHRYVH